MTKRTLLSSSPWASVYQDPVSNTCVKVCHHDTPPHDAERELAILKATKNANAHVIHLLDSNRNASDELCLIFPLFRSSLLDYIEAYSSTYDQKVDVLVGLADGLHFLHLTGIMHRDINPSNVLIKQDAAGAVAVLCDFGTAWHPDLPGNETRHELVSDVGTGFGLNSAELHVDKLRPYRAPELLFGLQDYDQSIDLWALGVTIAQILHPDHKVLFDARANASDLQLIASIFKTRGTPTIQNWLDASRCPSFTRFQFVDFAPISWEVLLPNVPNLLVTIVAGLICYNTVDRLSAKQTSVALRSASQMSINSASFSSSK